MKREDRMLIRLEGDPLVLIPRHRRKLSELGGALPATKPYQEHTIVRRAIREEMGRRLLRGEE